MVVGRDLLVNTMKNQKVSTISVAWEMPCLIIIQGHEGLCWSGLVSGPSWSGCMPQWWLMTSSGEVYAIPQRNLTPYDA